MSMMEELNRTMAVADAVRKRGAQNMRLGELIRLLETRPKDQRIAFDFCGFVPTRLESYRGYYEDLSFQFAEPQYGDKEMKVEHVLQEARDAMNATFTGYKGGDYLMDKDTLLWVARHGETGSTAILGIIGDDYETIIETGWLRT